MIELAEVRRTYRASSGALGRTKREIVALDGLTLQVGHGELYGLLGPNGAGKTTAIKILTTLLTPDSGRALVAGWDVRSAPGEIRSRIGFVLGGERGLYYRLSGWDNLRYFAALYGVAASRTRARIEEVIDIVGLRERARERVEGYSRGMKQRLHLARMLLHDPGILFLDEPTSGLDPIGARELRETVRRLREQGRTIILTTHYMFEADALCDRIGIIDHGRLIAEGTPAQLKDLVSDRSVIEVELFGAPSGIAEPVRSLEHVDSVVMEQQQLRQVLRVQSRLGERAVAPVLAALNGTRIGRVAVREATLEDAYVRLVGRAD